MNAKYVKCAAKCCGNTLLDNSTLTFFTFPENRELAKIWAHKAKVSYYYYGSTLCSAHFEDKYFNPDFGERSVFRQDMEPIPTIFNTKDIKSAGVSSIPQVTLVDPAKIMNKPQESVITSKEYCRLCANLFSTSNLNAIFFKYKEMMETCLPGKVLQKDQLPQYICIPCAHKLQHCAKTLKEFQEADKKLREMVKSKSPFPKTPSTSKELEIINISDDDDDLADFNEKVLLDDLMNVLTETNNILDEIANDPLNISDNEEPEPNPIEIRKKENYETKTKFRFQCLTCSMLFDFKEEVLVHVYHDHPYHRNDKIVSRIVSQKVQVPKVEIPRIKKFQCIACNILYDTKEEIFSHSSSTHNGNKVLSKIIEVAEIPQKTSVIKYMCLFCPTIRETQQEMKRHSSLYHSGTKIISKAILCDKKFTGNAPVISSTPVFKKSKPKENNYIKSNSEVKNYHPLFIEHGVTNTDYFHSHYTRKPENNIPVINYNVKYKCSLCSEILDTYNEIYNHFEKQHSNPLEQTDPIAIVCKVKEDCDISVDNNPEHVIEITDGTIIVLDPSVKQERLKYSKPKIMTETVFKCLACNKVFRNKQILVKHALAKHPSSGVTEINCKTFTVQRKVDYVKSKSKFECLTCSSLHISKFSLLRHTELLHPNISKNKFLYRFLDHQKRGPVQCLHCSYISKNYSQYCSHSKTHLSFHCKECGKKFVKINLLREHEKEHNQTDHTWNCIVCNAEFINRILLNRHELTHKTPKDVQCPKCNKKFNSDFDLKKHETKTHETCLCDICGKTYELPYIKHHLQTHNRDCPFKCKICAKEFKTSSMLFRHQRKHYTTNEKTICQICGKVICRSSIRLHMKIHSSQKDEVCDICGASFHRRDHLRQHRARHATEQTTYVCEHCLTILCSKKSYLQHLSSAHDIHTPLPTEKKVFQCTICDKQFSCKIYLDDHTRWHRGEKIYSCESCGKKFGTKIAVYQHRLTHLPYEQFKFQCNICNKRFKRAEQCRNHRRVHTGEKPFPCPICQRPFRVRGEMVKHMRVHTPKENRDVKLRIKPKETVITEETIQHIPSTVTKTYIRPKIRTAIRPTVNLKNETIESVNIKTDNIFETKNIIPTKKVKIAKVKTSENQTIFYIDEDSSDSLVEIGENMPELE